jgi:5-formyltetrahydrofolate cyclo-ligase
VDISLSKKKLRETIKKRVLSLSEEEKKQASKRIFEAVSILEPYKKASSVMLYASTQNEVDTFPLMEDLLRRGVILWLPWCDVEKISLVPVKIKDIKKDLVKGAYGILSPREPKDKSLPAAFNPSLVFVPGIAFDKRGNRLGRGLGYYDKFLTSLSPETFKVGLTFQCQTEEEIPTEPFDYRVDRVISA